MQKPNIKLIQNSKGSNQALVYCNGYTMKHNNNSQLWCHYLRKAHWNGTIYQLWWDSGSSLGRKYAMSPLGNIPMFNEVAHAYPHWKMVVKRAKIER
ncbi:hypothetical protein PCC7418_2111 [Halothece sp. PCC 7418]|uniref:hypothetical protein n=1 Tax=Halothece sp. (strain PCC 7418) TaxID=65093 RepID=UPI0002A07E0B|nr:hypothetical protein [Halothece sp. PCC 7418]AFZ44273.1 hypothetical protein PCC7418_2111 [Halothece sp. PCC 7418]